MWFTEIFAIVGIVILAFIIVKIIEKVILKHFFKTREIMSTTTAYDLCRLYKKKIISEKRLIQELTRWAFVPDSPRNKKIEDEWHKMMPPDPFGSFDEQIGRARKDKLISDELYYYLVDNHITRHEPKD